MQVSARNALRMLAVSGFIMACLPAGAQTSVQSLIAELRSPEPAVRGHAAHQLGQTHSRRAVEPLIAALDDSNVHVAEEAAEALGNLRAVEAVQPLIDSLRHSYCGGIVESNHKAPAALSAIGMPAIPAIMQAITRTSYGISGDASFELKSALDAIQSPEIVPPLVALLQSPNFEARIYAEERPAAHPGGASRSRDRGRCAAHAQ
jgi:HEAT repeat protein